MPCGSASGKIYGLVKVHKKNNPLRSVVSTIGTPEYEVAKLLEKIIQPYIPNKYMLDLTKDFIAEKFDVLRGRLLANHNDFHWQLGG